MSPALETLLMVTSVHLRTCEGKRISVLPDRVNLCLVGAAEERSELT